MPLDMPLIIKSSELIDIEFPLKEKENPISFKFHSSTGIVCNFFKETFKKENIDEERFHKDEFKPIFISDNDGVCAIDSYLVTDLKMLSLIKTPDTDIFEIFSFNLNQGYLVGIFLLFIKINNINIEIELMTDNCLLCRFLDLEGLCYTKLHFGTEIDQREIIEWK